jgi:hypothetical protein
MQKVGTARREDTELLFFDNYRLDKKETRTTETTQAAIFSQQIVDNVLISISRAVLSNLA